MQYSSHPLKFSTRARMYMCWFKLCYHLQEVNKKLQHVHFWQHWKIDIFVVWFSLCWDTRRWFRVEKTRTGFLPLMLPDFETGPFRDPFTCRLNARLQIDWAPMMSGQLAYLTSRTGLPLIAVAIYLFPWLSARLQYLHCWRTGDTAVLH